MITIVTLGNAKLWLNLPQTVFALEQLQWQVQRVGALSEIPKLPSTSFCVFWLDRFQGDFLPILHKARTQFPVGATHIIVYGALPSQHDLLLKSGVDMIIHQDPQEALPSLIKTLRTPFNPFLDQVPGIIFRNYFGNSVVNPSVVPALHHMPSVSFIQTEFKGLAPSYPQWFSPQISPDVLQKMCNRWQQAFQVPPTLVFEDVQQMALLRSFSPDLQGQCTWWVCAQPDSDWAAISPEIKADFFVYIPQHAAVQTIQQVMQYAHTWTNFAGLIITADVLMQPSLQQLIYQWLGSGSVRMCFVAHTHTNLPGVLALQEPLHTISAAKIQRIQSQIHNLLFLVHHPQKGFCQWIRKLRWGAYVSQSQK